MDLNRDVYIPSESGGYTHHEYEYPVHTSIIVLGRHKISPVKSAYAAVDSNCLMLG